MQLRLTRWPPVRSLAVHRSSFPWYRPSSPSHALHETVGNECLAGERARVSAGPTCPHLRSIALPLLCCDARLNSNMRLIPVLECMDRLLSLGGFGWVCVNRAESAVSGNGGRLARRTRVMWEQPPNRVNTQPRLTLSECECAEPVQNMLQKNKKDGSNKVHASNLYPITVRTSCNLYRFVRNRSDHVSLMSNVWQTPRPPVSWIAMHPLKQ